MAQIRRKAKNAAGEALRGNAPAAETKSTTLRKGGGFRVE